MQLTLKSSVTAAENAADVQMVEYATKKSKPAQLNWSCEWEDIRTIVAS